MNSESLKEEISKMETDLQKVTVLYTEVISNKQYDKRKFFEEKIKLMLTDIKNKTRMYEEMRNQN